MTAERRGLKRQEVPESEYFVFEHDTSVMGRIKNISLEGLKVEYVSMINGTIAWRKIDIFGMQGSRFYMFGIPCEQIYSIDELAQRRTFSGSRLRSSGLKFIRMASEQQKKLETLIHQIRSDS